MAKKTEHISSGEFSSLSGLPIYQVSKLLREGKIEGVKESGKWMIPKNQLKLKAVQVVAKKQNPSATKKKSSEAKKVSSSRKKTTVRATKETDQIKGDPQPPATPSSSKKTGSKHTYSVAEFSAMTYLTDFGVTDWLRKGRLKGTKDENGEWRIDVASLELPNLKRLLRY